MPLALSVHSYVCLSVTQSDKISHGDTVTYFIKKPTNAHLYYSHQVVSI